MSTPEIWAAVAFFTLCFISYLIYGPSDGSNLQDTNTKTLVPLSDINDHHELPSDFCTATLIRQSGNVYRDLGVFPTPAAALSEAAKSFRRAGVEAVRITYSDGEKFAAYRSIYNFRGRSEGKKLGGVILQSLTSTDVGQENALPTAVAAQIAGLPTFLHGPFKNVECTVSEVRHNGGTNWNLEFNFRCRLCDSTVLKSPDNSTDESIITCKSCGFAHGSVRELREFAQSSGLAHLKNVGLIDENGEPTNS